MKSEYYLICEYLNLTRSNEAEEIYCLKYPMQMIRSSALLIITDILPAFPQKRELNKRVNFILGLHEASSTYYEIFENYEL